ncbi:MAG: hypothetical protein AB7K09_06655 [Planctomycetota bacterium]
MTFTLSQRAGHRRGFTITELLVAGGIMTILGMGVIVIMRDTIGIWRDHETLRDEYDRGTAVLLQIEHDITSLSTDVAREPLWQASANNAMVGAPGASPQRAPRQRLIVGTDALNRPFIVFTRQLRDEMSNAVTRNSGWEGSSRAGNYLAPSGDQDGLRVLGNLSEVAFAFGPAPRYNLRLADGQEFSGEFISARAAVELNRLRQADATRNGWPDPPPVAEVDSFFTSGGIVPGTPTFRPETLTAATAAPSENPPPPGIDSPIRPAGFGFYRASISPPPPTYYDPTGMGYGSLFADFDANALNNQTKRVASDGIGGYQEMMIASWMRKYQLMAEGVLYVGFQMLVLDPDTRQYVWEPSEFATTDPGNPFFFDTAIGYDPIAGRRGAPFPNALRITVTVESLSGKPTMSTLAAPLEPGATEILLRDGWALPSSEGTHPFVLIGKGANVADYEWVWFEQASGNRLRGAHRGTRGTPAFTGTFPAGTPVRWGMTLQKIIQLRVTDAPQPGPAQPGVPPGIGPSGWTFDEQLRQRGGYQPSPFSRGMPTGLLKKD